MLMLKLECFCMFTTSLVDVVNGLQIFVDSGVCLGACNNGNQSLITRLVSAGVVCFVV